MRFSSVLAVVAALTASVSASPTAVDSAGGCPILCSDYPCCAGQKCVPQGIFVILWLPAEWYIWKVVIVKLRKLKIQKWHLDANKHKQPFKLVSAQEVLQVIDVTLGGQNGSCWVQTNLTAARRVVHSIPLDN
ncbi:uncharacterized protein BJ212DRAFT_1590184 [Suillus subaureus]|uniref:Hydrophobin n=1 Tax=Suillus subaureus TaxID=48587 RepID=A0A9P7J8N3_9AGAM|nr:uncharacterized protein BJ212DRAFT_1590184 [Suillus subaureus]KAG1808249.1 hypothetical protein BJ212DRAFT_1590184 [Suillus subaureus]